MTTIGLTPEGLSMPRAVDWLVILQDDLTARLQARGLPAPDYERDTFLGGMVAAVADRLGELSDAMVQTEAGYHLNNAVGVQLENLCLLVGVRRREATRSQVVLDVTADAGTTIPLFALVESDGPAPRAKWEIQEEVIFAAGGTQQVVALAVTSGPIEASASTITRIVTAESGWTAVNNPDPATPGASRESDQQLRRRRNQSLQIGTNATVAAVRSALLELPWTTAASVVDNPKMTTEVVEGITLPAKSLAAVVFPDNPTPAQEDQVLEALASTVSAGIETIGAESGSVTSPPGFVQTFRWGYAGQIGINVSSTISVKSGFSPSEVEAEVISRVEDYFASLSIGDDVFTLPIYALLADVDGLANAAVEFVVGASGFQTISINATNIAVINTNNVTVV